MSASTHVLSKRSGQMKTARQRGTLSRRVKVQRLNGQPHDGVSELLRAVKVHSTVYCLSDLSAPWGFQVEDSTAAKFHLVLEGSCVLTLDTGEQEPLQCGDMVLLPAGTGHVVRDKLDSEVRYLDAILAEHRRGPDAPLVYGGHGSLTRLVCGGFVLAEALPSRVLTL